MRRSLWEESYKDYEPPFWPCPACGRETLQPIPKSLTTIAPSGYEWLELTPIEYIYRFQQFFRCSVKECGDIVSAAGDAQLKDDRQVSGDEDPYYYMLFPRAIHRGLPIIDVPSQTPVSVGTELEAAFALFWMDLSSCANKMRVSVERALDELGIPAAPTLNNRIKEFEKIDPDHGQTFHALREVGNIGSHQGDNTRETILDAFEVYEDALKNLFGGHRRRIEQLKQKIRAAKGR